MKNVFAGDTSDREIVITRLINAPRALVFSAWTDPKQVIQWWGPNGFTNTIHEMEVKPGGIWRFMMHGPGGMNFPNKIEFLEVVEPERLVYLHGEEGDDGYFLATITFTTAGDKTELKMHSVFTSAEERNLVVEKYGALEGGIQHLGRLEEFIGKMSPEREFTITRVYDAPLDLVWKVYTEAEHLAKWWGPKGLKMLTAKVDLRPGGIFHYGMETPDGQQMWGKFMYREIVPKERLEFLVSFSDEHGGTNRHPMAPQWPLEMLNTVTFSEMNGKTVLTLKGSAFNASEEECRTYEAGAQSMQQGFKGTLDQLEDYLESQKVNR